MDITSFFMFMRRRPPISTRTDTLFPYTTLFRSRLHRRGGIAFQRVPEGVVRRQEEPALAALLDQRRDGAVGEGIGAVGPREAVRRAGLAGQVRSRGRGVDRQPRAEERRVGTGCVSPCRSGWSPSNVNKKNNRKQQ